MIVEINSVDKVEQSDYSNQDNDQQSRSNSSVDLIEDNNEELNAIRDKEFHDEPEIVILSNNEYHINNNSVNRESDINNMTDNNEEDEDISIIATREQPVREPIVVDLDNEPEIIDISNHDNSSNDLDDDLTIIEERNVPNIYVDEDSNLQTTQLHLPGGNSIQINISDYERPNRTSFLNGETRRDGFSNSNYRRNIFSTGDRIRLIRDLENIYSRSGPNSIPPDIRSYIMERLSNGNNGNNRERSRRRQRNNSSRNTSRSSHSRRLRRRLNNRYEYENSWVYDNNYEYEYENYEDEDDYGFNFGFGFGSDGTTNQRNYYEEDDERRTQSIINFIEQRENRERNIKIQKLKEKSEPIKQKFINSANDMEKSSEFTSNFTTFISTKETKDNNNNNNNSNKYDLIVPSCVLCGVELGVGIPDNYYGIAEEDRSLTFEDLVTKYGYHCPYQSLYRPTQLDKDLSKRTFISKNCGHLYCGRCFARIDNAKRKSKLSKKNLSELKGPSNPNNYGPRMCPAKNCTTIIRVRGRLKEVYF